MSDIFERVLHWATNSVGTRAQVLTVERLRQESGPWLVRIKNDGSIVELVLKIGPKKELSCEAAALRLAEEHGVLAARMRAVDLDLAQGTAALLTTYLRPGTTNIPLVATSARLRALGAAAAAIHRIPLKPSPELPRRARHCYWTDFAAERRWAAQYQAATEQERPRVLTEIATAITSRDDGELLELPAWESAAARERLLSTRSTPLLDRCEARLRDHPVPAGDMVFVHGDLWQGNTLWVGDGCVGVIDWDSAGAGHYGVDLGSLRWDSAILFGLPAAAEVLAGWEEARGMKAEHVAYWDLVAALNTPADMAGFEPSFHEAGRRDLDGVTLTSRRDAFLQAALHNLDSGQDVARAG